MCEVNPDNLVSQSDHLENQTDHLKSQTRLIWFYKLIIWMHTYQKVFKKGFNLIIQAINNDSSLRVN